MQSLKQFVLPLVLALAAVLLGTTGCSKEGKAARHLADADRHFANREFERAKIEYYNVLQEQPTNHFAVMRLAKIFTAQGQIVDAIPMLLWSRRQFPDDKEVRETLIDVYALAGGETNRVRLMTEIDELLTLDPANHKAVLALAETSRTPEEVAALEKRIAELQAKAGDKPVFKLVAAELSRRRGDTNACETAIRAAMALDPKGVTAHATYAAFLLSLGRTAEAETAFRAAAEMAPPYSPVRERWARYLLERRRLDEARAVLDEINAKAPERVSAWTARAELALAETKVDEAERLVARALGQAPNDGEALRVFAQIKLAQRKPTEAVQAMTRVAEKQPNSGRTQYQLALAHLLNRDPVRAVGALEQAVQLEPDFPNAALLLAEMRLGRGEADQAVTGIRDVLRRNPNNEEAVLQLVRAERAAGRLEDAFNTTRTGRQRFPTNAAIAFQQGLILNQLNRTNQARAVFEEISKLTTNDIAAVEQLIAMDAAARDFPTALRRVQGRIDRAPGDPTLWLMKSEVHLAQRDFPQAEAALRKVLELDPENQDAFMSLARSYIASGNQAKAVAELDQLVKRRPNDVQALLTMGMLQTDLKDHARAREAYEKALKLRPDFPPALNNLAYLLADHFNQLDEGRKLAARARELAPDDPVVADTLGWIEYRRGQYPEALRLLTEAAGKLGENPEVQYHLGMTHYMMGQENPARAALQIAATSNRDFSGRDVARDYLAMLQVDSGKADAGAIRALEKRRQEAPNDVIALSRLGTAYELTGSAEKAREAYEAALKLSPQSVPILSRLATLYAQTLKNPTRALELAKTARNLAPNDPAIAHTLGRLAFAAGDEAWALTLLQDSARRLNNRPDVAYDLAWAAYSQGRLDDANRGMQAVARSDADPKLKASASTFLEMTAVAANPAAAAASAAKVQEVLKGEPDHAAALFAYGIVAEGQNQAANARTAYERLLGRFEAFTPAIRQLAILYSERLGDDAKAQELGLKARQAYPRDDALAAALGKAVCRRGDFNYAVQLLSEAARTRTNDASVFYHLGVAYQGQKKNAEGKAALEKALALEPNGSFVEDAKKRLEELKGG